MYRYFFFEDSNDDETGSRHILCPNMSEPYGLKALNNWLIIANQQDMSKWRQKMSQLGGGFGCFSPSRF